MNEYYYRYFPSGNADDFPGIDGELIRRDIKADMSVLPNGSRMYRIHIDDVGKLPHDNNGPYIGDDYMGWSISPNSRWEDFRIEWCGYEWEPVK